MAQIIQIRRDTSTNWTAINPILAQGEQTLETNTLKRKIGDGVTTYNALPYEASILTITGISPVAVSAGAAPVVSILPATTLAPGSMSSADKTKLDAVLGTNTGNDATNTQYSGLAAAKENVGVASAGDISHLSNFVHGDIAHTNRAALDLVSGTNSGDQTLASLSAEATVNKDATGGYAGLTLFALNLKNAANTFTNFLTNATTAARTWTMPDKDGTVAMTSDITVGNVIGLGAGVATALAVNVGSAGASILFNGAGGTPSSMTLTSATDLPVAGGGTGVATFAAKGILFGNDTSAVGVTQVGISGHVLTSKGAGVNPVFEAVNPDVGSANNKLVTTFTQGDVSPTPSYSNAGGTGDRRAIVGINTTVIVVGNILQLINGDTTANQMYFSNAATAEKYVRFDFETSKVIDEALFYQSNTSSHGVWKWQGSNDATTWTDVGGTFTLGGATTQTITTLSANTTGYRYYQILGISGSTSDSPYVREFEFKIVASSLSLSYALKQVYITNGLTPGGIISLQGLGGMVGIGTLNPARTLDVVGSIRATTTITTGGYTVATLPAGIVGMCAYVTDASGPVYGAAVSGGGLIHSPVFKNATAWVFT